VQSHVEISSFSRIRISLPSLPPDTDHTNQATIKPSKSTNFQKKKSKFNLLPKKEPAEPPEET
jgi:hypothetical protein